MLALTTLLQASLSNSNEPSYDWGDGEFWIVKSRSPSALLCGRLGIRQESQADLMVLGPTSEALQCGVKSVLHSDLRLIHVIRLPTVLSDRLSSFSTSKYAISDDVVPGYVRTRHPRLCRDKNIYTEASRVRRLRFQLGVYMSRSRIPCSSQGQL